MNNFYMELTPQKVDRLEKRYAQAVENNEEQFTFDGHEFLTEYAKYLLQYLKGVFHANEHTY